MTDVVTAIDARALTDQIKVTVEGAWLLIMRAYETRAWSALGYQTWDEYCTREFGSSRLRLPREERQEIVASLRDAGLSTRAIAAATGVSKTTVADELAGVQNRTPAPTPTPRVNGTDGKTYPAAAAAAPTRRSPLPDIAQRAGWDLRKSVERLERIAHDDRFAANKRQVAAHLLGHLSHALEVCQDLLEQLDHRPGENR